MSLHRDTYGIINDPLDGDENAQFAGHFEYGLFYSMKWWKKK